jgi:hypothetical protein
MNNVFIFTVHSLKLPFQCSPYEYSYSATDKALAPGAAGSACLGGEVSLRPSFGEFCSASGAAAEDYFRTRWRPGWQFSLLSCFHLACDFLRQGLQISFEFNSYISMHKIMLSLLLITCNDHFKITKKSFTIYTYIHNIIIPMWTL